MFLRKKRINNQYYAYAVTNRWTKEGSRQKATYVGKILIPFVVEPLSLDEHLEADPITAFKEQRRGVIIDSLVTHALRQRGFTLKTIEGIGTVWQDETHYYQDRCIRKITTKKEVVIEAHEGFLCAHTLQKLLYAKITGYDEREQGIKLAKLVLEAGLHIDEAIFVVLFERWTRKEEVHERSLD